MVYEVYEGTLKKEKLCFCQSRIIYVYNCIYISICLPCMYGVHSDFAKDVLIWFVVPITPFCYPRCFCYQNL